MDARCYHLRIRRNHGPPQSYRTVPIVRHDRSRFRHASCGGHLVRTLLSPQAFGSFSLANRRSRRWRALRDIGTYRIFARFCSRAARAHLLQHTLSRRRNAIDPR